MNDDETQTLNLDYATFCDGCDQPMWLGLDVQRRSQEGEDFYCDTCTEAQTTTFDEGS